MPNRDDGVVGAEVVGDLKGHIGAGCARELGAAGSPPELCDGSGRGAGRRGGQTVVVTEDDIVACKF